MLIALSIFIVYLICSMLSAGMLFAYFQESFPELAARNWRENLGYAIALGLCSGVMGPVGALVYG